MTTLRADAPLYVEALLTALARGHAASVELVASERLPDPAALTSDALDLDWLASAGLDLEALASEKVINLVLEAAGIRRFHLRRTEGRIRTSLEAHDGSAQDVDFVVARHTADDGRVHLTLTRL
jgi:hypothetical protein